ncbi:MAG TPA: adenine deaminase [Candidatus Avidesulfovibrio excrementigallinarum]|nr:adenine deaminase [Candidatus Avidesulfovibrio excrementigallinarum]
MANSLQRRINMAAGREPADLLITNARVVNVFTGDVEHTDVAIGEGVILGYGPRDAASVFDAGGACLLPGLIDAHIHIESSMLSPARFAELALPRGTTTVVADPHELVNVAGVAGLRYFLDCAASLPLNLRIAVPSCVPATPFEDAGAVLHAEDMAPFMRDPYVVSVGEMMNFPGVVAGDPDVLDKIQLGHESGRGIDGHVVGLPDKELDAYMAAGIRNNHECNSIEEMHEILRRGGYILLREGSAARNLGLLLRGITPANARRCALCCDDRHAEDFLRDGYMDHLLRLAVAQGTNPLLAVTLCTLNAAEAMGLHGKGGIAPGWDADLVLVDNLHDFTVLRTWIGGRCVAAEGRVLAEMPRVDASLLTGSVRPAPLTPHALDVCVPSGRARVIELAAGSLITRNAVRNVQITAGGLFDPAANPGICKLAVIERHKRTGLVGTGLLAGYGLHGGAVATSVAHDSHNIVVAGDSDKAMRTAVDRLIALGGGCVICRDNEILAELALPLAGLMSDDEPAAVSETLAVINRLAHTELGIPSGVDPLMSLSFMALPVIPSLKLTARGLFDVDRFCFVSVDAAQ